jgi:acetyltransferase-like isoleucine patch superfamily enzyme
VWDRARAKSATKKYNKTVENSPDVNEEELRRMLGVIFNPTLESFYKPNMPLPREKGVLGHRVSIEQGFSCTYGYNIKLMDNVFIDCDVRIDDAGKVEIGARTWIGENVKISTSTACFDLHDRKGPSTERIAYNVIIESDVQIGAHSIICPGVRLAKGCTILPGTVVDVNVESMKTFGPKDANDRGSVPRPGLC